MLDMSLSSVPDHGTLSLSQSCSNHCAVHQSEVVEVVITFNETPRTW